MCINFKWNWFFSVKRHQVWNQTLPNFYGPWIGFKLNAGRSDIKLNSPSCLGKGNKNGSIYTIKQYTVFCKPLVVVKVQWIQNLFKFLCSELIGVLFIQVKLTKINYNGTLLKVGFIQDSGLFRVQFRQISLYLKVCL